MRVTWNDLHEGIADRDERLVEISFGSHHSRCSQQATVGGADHPFLDCVAYGHSGSLFYRPGSGSTARKAEPPAIMRFCAHCNGNKLYDGTIEGQ